MFSSCLRDLRVVINQTNCVLFLCVYYVSYFLSSLSRCIIKYLGSSIMYLPPCLFIHGETSIYLHKLLLHCYIWLVLWVLCFGQSYNQLLYTIHVRVIHVHDDDGDDDDDDDGINTSTQIHQPSCRLHLSYNLAMQNLMSCPFQHIHFGTANLNPMHTLSASPFLSNAF